MAQGQIEKGALGRELAQIRFSRLYREQGRAILAYALRRVEDRRTPPTSSPRPSSSPGGASTRSRSTPGRGSGSTRSRAGRSPTCTGPSGAGPASGTPRRVAADRARDPARAGAARRPRPCGRWPGWATTIASCSCSSPGRSSRRGGGEGPRDLLARRAQPPPPRPAPAAGPARATGLGGKPSPELDMEEAR